jgi:hypothetical protein
VSEVDGETLLALCLAILNTVQVCYLAFLKTKVKNLGNQVEEASWDLHTDRVRPEAE